jgi:hypothetical protein
MSQATWDRLAELAAADDHVAGLVLTGGRGKGVATALSDWDGVLVVTDEGMPRWSTYDFEDLDMTVISEADFVDYAEPETAFSWRAYDFAHLHPAVDRRGFSARLETKGRLTEARAKQLALPGGEEPSGWRRDRGPARPRRDRQLLPHSGVRP